MKRDINYDAKHGHSDEKMTADEKHISKLAGDMKYDKKHHGMAMSAFHKHDEWQTKIDAAKEEWKNADPPKKGDFYEENRGLYEAQEKAKQAHKKEEKE